MTDLIYWYIAFSNEYKFSNLKISEVVSLRDSLFEKIIDYPDSLQQLNSTWINLYISWNIQITHDSVRSRLHPSRKVLYKSEFSNCICFHIRIKLTLLHFFLLLETRQYFRLLLKELIFPNKINRMYSQFAVV